MTKAYDVEDAEKNGHVRKYRLFPSSRGSLALVGFFGCTILYLMRVNLSVAIVCMTIDEEDDVGNVTTMSPVNAWHDESLGDNWDARVYPYRKDEEQCPGEEGGEDDDTEGEFYWDRELRGTINSSFFWGYVLTQIMAGILVRRYGAKWILATGILFLIGPTLLSPPASHLSPYALMLMRFIEGLGSGVYFPCFHHIWALWAPPNERSFLVTFVLCGNSWGSLISFALSGVLCAELGWEWVFWTYAIFGMIWFVFWVIFAYDPPEVHPRISKDELDYIKTSKMAEEHDSHQIEMKTPWLKLFTSPCVLCIYLTQFCSAWGGYTTLTALPQYMKDILKLDIKQNGFYNSLPHFCKFVMTLVLAIIADALISKKVLTIGHTRKLMQSLAFLLPAMFLLIVGFLDCFSTGLVITCLTLAEGFTAGTRCGAITNIVDIAPRFAGLLMGIGNTIANVAGIFAPMVAGYLTPDGTVEQWRNVFYLSAFLYILGWVVFMIFESGHVQPWAIPQQQENDVSSQKVFSVEMNEPETNPVHDNHCDVIPNAGEKEECETTIVLQFTREKKD